MCVIVIPNEPEWPVVGECAVPVVVLPETIGIVTDCMSARSVEHLTSLSLCFPGGIMMALCLPPPPPKEFIANHPFVFVVQNLELGVVLFAGRFSQV
jgi:hypothetical protein